MKIFKKVVDLVIKSNEIFILRNLKGINIFGVLIVCNQFRDLLSREYIYKSHDGTLIVLEDIRVDILSVNRGDSIETLDIKTKKQSLLPYRSNHNTTDLFC